MMIVCETKNPQEVRISSIVWKAQDFFNHQSPLYLSLSAIVLATCNTVLLLGDVKLANIFLILTHIDRHKFTYTSPKSRNALQVWQGTSFNNIVHTCTCTFRNVCFRYFQAHVPNMFAFCLRKHIIYLLAYIVSREGLLSPALPKDDKTAKRKLVSNNLFWHIWKTSRIGV